MSSHALPNLECIVIRDKFEADMGLTPWDETVAPAIEFDTTESLKVLEIKTRKFNSGDNNSISYPLMYLPTGTTEKQFYCKEKTSGIITKIDVINDKILLKDLPDGVYDYNMFAFGIIFQEEILGTTNAGISYIKQCEGYFWNKRTNENGIFILNKKITN